MSKENKNMMVPALRFPEFDDTWSYLNGDELFEQISDKNHNSDLPILAITQEYGAIPRDRIDYNVSVSDKSIESYKVVKVGDFIISLRSFQGGIEYSEYEGLCSPAYIVLRKKNEREIVNLFFKHYFKTKAFIRDLNKNLEGLRDGKMVSYKQFSDIKSPYPKPAEQHKIASCLSSLDGLITAHIQKLDTLKAHKKGLMQQLFPSEREKVPKLRFKEFKNSGEWEEIMLIDTANKNVKWSFTGGPFGSNLKASDYLSNGVRVIQLQNIGDGEFHDEYKIFTSEEKANELLSCNIYPGEIILSKMGDPVGRACLIPNTHNRYVMCSDGIRLVIDEKKYSKYFIYALINSKHFRPLVEKTATGSTRKRIGLDDLKVLPMVVPKDIREQQKIASLLFSLDEMITAEAERINQLKMYKKGLMQGLFPIINEKSHE